MFIYLGVFAISTILLASVELSKNKLIREFISILAILLPAILAGCRDSSVGVDTGAYGISFFQSACLSDSFMEFFKPYMTSITGEPLFFLIIYIASRFTNNYHAGLFAYNLITIIFLYAGMKRYKKLMNTPIWLGMLLYYLAFYNRTLNMMRQAIAISVVFYSVSYLFEKKFYKYIIWIIVAFGFHNSAIIGLLFLPMYLILDQENNITIKKQLKRSIIFLGCVILLLSIGSVGINFLVSKGIVRDNYLNYLSGGRYSSHKLSIGLVMIYIIYFILYMKHYKYLNQRRLHATFFAIISILSIFSCFGSLISTFISRIGYYFTPLQMLSMANIVNCYNIKSKKDWIILIVSYTLLIWFITFVIKGHEGTIPYIYNIQV